VMLKIWYKADAVEPDLYCEIRKTDKEGIHFAVHNGAWDGVLHGSTVYIKARDKTMEIHRWTTGG